jgi:hypothetical protein
MEVDCAVGNVVMDGDNDIKTGPLDAAPNPPTCSSISRTSGGVVWESCESKKRSLLADIADSNLEKLYGSMGSEGVEGTD